MVFQLTLFGGNSGIGVWWPHAVSIYTTNLLKPVETGEQRAANQAIEFEIVGQSSDFK